MTNNPREPTSEECTAKAHLGGGWYALWWPQMGGYVGKAAAQAEADGCVEIVVWHDGDFPFSGRDLNWSGKARNPARLHLCDPDHFRSLADDLNEITELSVSQTEEK